MYNNLEVRDYGPSCDCKEGYYSPNRDDTSDICL